MVVMVDSSVVAVPVVVMAELVGAAAAAMPDLEDARGRMALECLLVNDDDEPLLVNVDCGGWDCLR